MKGIFYGSNWTLINVGNYNNFLENIAINYGGIIYLENLGNIELHNFNNFTKRVNRNKSWSEYGSFS